MKTAQKNKLPPACPRCDAPDSPFALVEHEVEQVFRGDTLRVKSPVMACRNCGFEILAEGQLDELVRRTHEAYRKKHKLLTRDRIIAGRKKLSLTQDQFAKLLAVSIASVKRWEAGYVQDKNSDQRIREKIEQGDLPLTEFMRVFLSGGKRLELETLSPDFAAQIDDAFMLWCKASHGQNDFLQARTVEFLSKILRATHPRCQHDITWSTVWSGGSQEPNVWLAYERRAQHASDFPKRSRRPADAIVHNRSWTLHVPGGGSREPLFDEESNALELTA